MPSKNLRNNFYIKVKRFIKSSYKKIPKEIRLDIKKYQPFSGVFIFYLGVSFLFLLILLFVGFNTYAFSACLGAAVASTFGWINYFENKKQFDYQVGKERKESLLKQKELSLDYLNHDYKLDLIYSFKELLIGQDNIKKFESELKLIENIKISNPEFYKNMIRFFEFYENSNISLFHMNKPYFLYGKLKDGIDKALSISEYQMVRILLSGVQACYYALHNTTRDLAMNNKLNNKVQIQIDEIEKYYNDINNSISKERT